MVLIRCSQPLVGLLATHSDMDVELLHNFASVSNPMVEGLGPDGEPDYSLETFEGGDRDSHLPMSFR